ncbi:hypothetical protein GCM10009847_25300 [Leucobacter tardus]|uniref:YihY/virulence factor BrkB family protein n=1 Tax=Leucobacter tardus TaxID=501483 RepID=A0A939QL96_9MICO|nr:YihY/virulence factor BrkB family protein [Leucobacter tardus]MBO2989961.1 YihY/virulence factor BrkB family protein [Leucobacter tardus]
MPEQKRGLVPKLISRALELRLVRAFLLYSEHKGSMLADSITYRALFSVFAAVLLGFSIAALWLAGNPEAMQSLIASLDSVIPGIGDFVDPEAIEAPTGFTIAGIVSMGGLLFAAISAIGSLRSAIRMIGDQVTETQQFVWVILRNLMVGIAFGGLLIAAAAASFLGSVGIDTVSGWLGFDAGSPVAQTLTRAFGIAVVFIIDTVAIALVFRLLSGISAPARALWVGAMLGGVGLTVLQELSGLFVRGATSNPLLATFGALIALLLWFNLSAQVILIASSYIVTAAAESQDRVRAKFGAENFAQRRRQRAEDKFEAARSELLAAQEAEAEARASGSESDSEEEPDSDSEAKPKTRE